MESGDGEASPDDDRSREVNASQALTCNNLLGSDILLVDGSPEREARCVSRKEIRRGQKKVLRQSDRER
jgi:hypothetical protein